jgi:hypothetical protein
VRLSAYVVKPTIGGVVGRDKTVYRDAAGKHFQAIEFLKLIPI